MAPGDAGSYLHIGFQYYLAGRAAVRHQSNQIVGNLFHHAIEMLLKWTLLENKAFDQGQLWRKFGHDLTDLWEATKSAVSEDWTRFDGFIAELHRWEQIRYGEFPTSKTKSLRVDRIGTLEWPAAPGLDEYRVNLKRVDDLVHVLLNAQDLNPRFVRTVLIPPSSRAIDDYEFGNQYAITEPDDGFVEGTFPRRLPED